MHATRIKVLLSTPDMALRHDFVPAMTQLGFETRIVDTPVALTPLLAAEHYEFCVLDARRDSDAVLATVARLRIDPGIGLVLLTDAGQVDTRIHGLLIGADTCVTLPCLPREFAAVMLSLARRTLPGAGVSSPSLGNWHAPRVVMYSDAWHLTDDDNVLVSPDGVRLDLSAGERVLMRAMADSPGQTLSREYIGALLDESPLQGNAVTAVPRAPQRVSMLVSRLRKKCSRAGAALPLRVVRGSGYAFVATLERRGQKPGADSDRGDEQQAMDEIIA